jgi:hypothetical protein
MADIDPRFLEQLERMATVSDTVSAALGRLGKSELAQEIQQRRLTTQLQKELGLRADQAKQLADEIKAAEKRQTEEDKLLDYKKKREEAIARGFGQLAGALGDLAKSTISNNSAIYNSDKAFSAAAPVLSTLGNAIKGITQAFASMAAGIPFVGGIFAGAQQILGAAVDMAVAIKQQQLENAQKYIDTYQTLSKAGVTFGGDIEAMSAAASRGGMAIDQYSKFVTNSIEDLAKAGGTLQQAANRVMTMSQSALAGNNAKLLTIYGTYENLNGALATYQGTMSSMGFDTFANQKKLNDSSAAYLYSLKELQALTGLSADQYKKEAEERAKYAAYQLKLNSMAPDVASRLDQQVSLIGKLYGKQAQDLAVESVARNGRLISSTALEFKAFNGPVADVVQKLIDMSTTVKDEKELQKERIRLIESAEPAVQEQIRRNATLAGLVFGSQDKIITSVNQSQSDLIKGTDKRKNIEKAQTEITAEQNKLETEGSKSYRQALDSLTDFKKRMDEITRASLPGLGDTVSKLLKIQETLYDTFTGPRWDAAVDYFIQKIYDMANALGNGTPGGAERGMSTSEVASQRNLSTSAKFKKQLTRPTSSAEGVVPDNLVDVPDSIAKMFKGGRQHVLQQNRNTKTGGKLSQTTVDMMQMIQDAFPGAMVTSGTGGHTGGGHVLGRAFDWALPSNSEFLQSWTDFQDPNSPVNWNGQPPNILGLWSKRPSKSYADFVTDWMKQRGMTKSINEYNNPSSGADGPHFHAEFDKGGNIPAGSQGIVGERGYEIVDGPATVTSTNQTTAMFKNMSTTFTKMLSVMGEQRDALDKIANHTA